MAECAGVPEGGRVISRKYLYLIALAREKHFGRAAASCHVSPSTLSAAIRDLESELGVAVVERGQQFAGLTPEGQRVLDYAQRAAASTADLHQELARLRGGLSGRLRLGVIPTALTVVASLTSGFALRHPQVRSEVLSLSTGEILARLHAFELEAGIIYAESAAQPDLAMVPLSDEDHVVLAPADGQLAERDAISWQEAAQLNLCLLTPDMQNRRTIDGVFLRLGCRPNVTLESNSIVSILAHVCSGTWCSIVPRAVLELIGMPHGVKALDLVEPRLAWQIALVAMAREPRSPMVQALFSEAINFSGRG